MAGGLGVAAVVVAVLLGPGFALGLLVALVYLNFSDVLVRSFGFPSILQLMALPILISAWTHHGPGLSRRIVGEPLTWLLAAYTLVLLLSITWALEPGLAERRFADIVKALVLYVLLVALVTSPRRARIAVWTMVGVGGFLGAVGILRLTMGVWPALAGLARVKRAHLYGDVFGDRLAGPLGDPNYFAQILLILVPLALFLTWEEKALRNRLTAVLSLGLIVSAAVLTYSRGGALALALVVGASFLAQGVQWRRIVLGGLAVAMGASLLVPSGFRERLTTMGQFLPDEAVLTETDSSFEERMVLMGAAWEMLADNSMLGVGAGNYTARFGEYAERFGSVALDYRDPDDVRYPHSLYLEVGAETGALGLLVFLAALLTAFVGLHRARDSFVRTGYRATGALARALQISLAGYLVSSFFLHGDFERYLWLLLGMAGALHAMSRMEAEAALGVRHGR